MDAPDARTRLMDAALRLVRRQGWAGTSVEGLCAEAGVTKGSFFHHFKTKEALGVAAAGHWGARSGALFAAGPHQALTDPAARVLAYIDYRAALLGEDLGTCTCFVGTLVQEAWASHPALREACGAVIDAHAAILAADIEAARPADADWTAESLAQFTQAVLQGAFVLAKAAGDVTVARAQVAHLRRYVEMLLGGRANG